MEYYSTIKKEENPALYNNMNGPCSIMLSEVRERQILYGITYIKSKKVKFTETENRMLVTKAGSR